MNELRDIHVTMGNPWWPPAIGWWLLLGAVVAIIVLAWRFRATWRLHIPIPMVTLGDWRWDAGRALRRLRREADSGPLKVRAAALSELLRRIAMARHGRGACAGLHGQDWLDWLSGHDPAGFDWRKQGQLLISAPYAPDRADSGSEAELARLIDAAEPWITSRRPRRAPAAASGGARRSGIRHLLTRRSPGRLRSEGAGP